MCAFLWAAAARAGNVILMIGDGMGLQHILCSQDDDSFLYRGLPLSGFVSTNNALGNVTDSAAAATAYACGVKTRNGYLGMLPDKTPCSTIAEDMAESGGQVGLYTTDKAKGATPAGFYAHVEDRKDDAGIQSHLDAAQKTMTIRGSLKDLAPEMPKILSELKPPFFAMIEGSDIDKKSHAQKMPEMQAAMKDFDRAVRQAYKFARQTPDTTLIVLADHETGGIDEDCRFTTAQHTGVEVPLFAAGAQAARFIGPLDNTEIHAKMRQILFDKGR
ncbi:MAG: alkaline phosphatase [Alphaproteobacteria bacterium]|nr:alkaline phosphatase [Alphaproteobacteria bacterium]